MKKQDLKRFIKIEELHTERLLLRKISHEDLDDVYAYASDPLVSRYLLWYPHPTKSFTKKYLSLIESKYRRAEFYDWGIVYEGHMIGTCGFTSFSIENNSAEIGYVLSSAYWGREIAKEAACAVISYGFEVLSLNRIEARYMVDNTASGIVASKCKMSYEATLREAVHAKNRYFDIAISSITATEYFKYKKEGIL